MEGKRVSDSRVTVQHQVLPYQANNAGKMHGGELLRLLDSAGAICAFRHARGTLVTAAIEHMAFIAPIQPGDIIMFHCSVNAVHHSSMEVGVRIEAEEYLSGAVRHVSTGYLTFVAINEQGRPRELPPLIAETEEDTRRMADASRRMAISRMGRRKTDGFTHYFQLEELADRFVLCQLPAAAALPSIPQQQVLGMVRSAHAAFFAVAESAFASLDTAVFSEVSASHTALAIKEGLNHNSVGVLASICAVLASARVTVFVLSTLDTNFVLFPLDQRATALRALQSAGHRIDTAS